MSVVPNDCPGAVLERLRTLYSDPRRHRSLDIIDAVCRSQYEHGSHDYSLKTIGRLSAARNGPARAALANPMGSPYRELIAAHERAWVPVRAVDVADKGDDSALLAGVKEPLQRARIKAALADARRLAEEAKRWRRKANALQAVANGSATLTLTQGAGTADLPVASLGRTASIDLLPIEKAALAAALDTRHLEKAGLSVDARGRVLDSSGRAVFPIGFATMLAKVARAMGVQFGDGTSVTSPTQLSDPRG